MDLNSFKVMHAHVDATSLQINFSSEKNKEEKVKKLKSIYN